VDRAVKETIALGRDAAREGESAVATPTDAKLPLRRRVLTLLVLAAGAWCLVGLAAYGLYRLFF
jgi:hypothetical protein